MKYLKSYNESLRDKMSPKSEDEIKNKILKMSPQDELNKSCEIGYLEGVIDALDRGANIHDQFDMAFALSSYHDHPDIMEYLLENGADVNSDGSRPILYACRRGDLETIKLLLKYKAKVNFLGFSEPLRRCVFSGNYEAVKLLLDYGAFIDSNLLEITEDKEIKKLLYQYRDTNFVRGKHK